MNNYKILTLGPSGAGKTIFLASLFKAFSIQQEKYGFYLEVEDSTKRKSLNKIYDELITGEKWPTGTRNISEWTFNCCVKNRHLSNAQVCQFTYIDYTGGIITDLLPEENTYEGEFNLVVKKADAVLVIIDGQKTLLFMQDKELKSNQVWQWVQNDLCNLMQLVDKYEKNTPVHFLISKWDLLENKYKLQEIKSQLLEKVPEFSKVVKNRTRAGCPVRLIPVSSIGKNFAILQPNGEMKKKPGEIPKPEWVEVPLAFALTDKLQIQKNQKRFSSAIFRILRICFYFLLGLIILILSNLYPRQIVLIVGIGGLLFLWMEIIRNNNAFKRFHRSCIKIQGNFFKIFPETKL